jgi:Holliday junction resolvase-like predicted endonuclease
MSFWAMSLTDVDETNRIWNINVVWMADQTHVRWVAARFDVTGMVYDHSI